MYRPCTYILNQFTLRSFSNREIRSFQTLIRNAHLSDIDSIENCNLLSLPEHYDRSHYVECINNRPTLTFVAEDISGNVIAYALACIQDDSFRRTGFLTGIAVGPSSRGRGIGLSLMNAVHTEVLERHFVESISLHVRPSNFRALKFYRNLGYTENAYIQMYYGDGEAAWLLTKSFNK